MYERNIEVAGRTVTIREVTLKAYRAWLKDVIAQSRQEEIPLYSVDRDLFEDFALTDLSRFTDLTVDQLDEMRPSDLRKVIAAIKEVNPDFFEMRGRMRNTANQVLSMMEEHLKSLSAPLASSSSMDTTMSGPTP